jgi:hypothetical protein
MDENQKKKNAQGMNIKSKFSLSKDDYLGKFLYLINKIFKCNISKA